MLRNYSNSKFSFMIISIILLSFYLFRTLIFKIGFEKQYLLNSAKNENISLSTSILVPARDEEANVKTCIESLNSCEYLNDKLEIVAINDRSSDSTSDILHSLARNIDYLKVIDIETDLQKGNLKGKAGALQIGASNANNDILMMTDADCTVHSKWIKTIGSQFDKQTGLIASFTLIKGDSIFDKIQAIEWLFLHTMACGGVGMGLPMGCYGNNLSIKKEVFNAVGGYKNIKFSVTEDLALLLSVDKLGYKIKYLCDFESSVETIPVQGMSEYLKQRKRWVLGGKALGWKAIAFVIFSLTVWLSLVWGIYCRDLSIVLLTLFTKIFLDSVLIYKPLKEMNKLKLLPYLPFAIMFFMIMELVAPFLIINKKVVWKGQTFQT